MTKGQQSGKYDPQEHPPDFVTFLYSFRSTFRGSLHGFMQKRPKETSQNVRSHQSSVLQTDSTKLKATINFLTGFLMVQTGWGQMGSAICLTSLMIMSFTFTKVLQLFCKVNMPPTPTQPIFTQHLFLDCFICSFLLTSNPIFHFSKKRSGSSGSSVVKIEKK